MRGDESLNLGTMWGVTPLSLRSTPPTSSCGPARGGKGPGTLMAQTGHAERAHGMLGPPGAMQPAWTVGLLSEGRVDSGVRGAPLGLGC